MGILNIFKRTPKPVTGFTPREHQELVKLAAKKRAHKMTSIEQARFLELGAKDFSKRFLKTMETLSRG